MNLDAVSAVSDPPGEAVSAGKTKDVRPESDPLHHAADADTSGGAQVICDF